MRGVPGLIREKRDAEHDLPERDRRICAGVPPKNRIRLRLAGSHDHLRNQRQKLRRHHGQHRGRPEPVSARQYDPSGDEEREQHRRHEAAPEVVQDFPARNQRERIALDAVALGDEGEQPQQDLPIAADPSVLPPRMRKHARRILIDQFDVRDESDAGMKALEEVV